MTMSKKRALAMICLLVAALLLSACQAKPQDNTQTQSEPALQAQQPPMETPTDMPATAALPEGYNPTDEEDKDGELTVGSIAAPAQNEQQHEGSIPGSTRYAGATPITLYPVDMPTPTPPPDLVFKYAPYKAQKLGISFECVTGYVVDESQANKYILTEPIEQQKDNVSAQFLFEMIPVNSGYKAADIKGALKTRIDEMATAYKSWSVSEISSRSLLKQDGYYMTYRGVKADGTIVRGRIHMALLEGNRVLMLQVTAPGWYNTSFTNVYTHIRNTIKVI